MDDVDEIKTTARVPREAAEPIAAERAVSNPTTQKSPVVATSIARPPASLPLLVLSSLAVLAAMYIARDVIIPVVLAMLLALLLRPILRRMRKLHLPDMFSALVLVGAVVAVFSFGVWTLADNAHEWLKQAPEMLVKVRALVPTKTGTLKDIEKTTAAVHDLAKGDNAKQPMQVEVRSQEFAFSALGVSSHFVGSALIVFVLGYFILALSDTLLRQAIGLRPSLNEKRNIVELLRNVESGISQYLLTITVINMGLGGATAAAMWLLGIPNPILWGVMATTLNYVPHVGAFLCLVILFLVGSVTHQSLSYGGVVAGVFVVLTSIESYFVTPLVLSKQLQLSPLAIILSILFWGWLWGIAGGLMAAPLLAVLKIICDQFESLHGLAAFLSGESPDKNAPVTPESSAA